MFDGIIEESGDIYTHVFLLIYNFYFEKYFNNDIIRCYHKFKSELWRKILQK